MAKQWSLLAILDSGRVRRVGMVLCIGSAITLAGCDLLPGGSGQGHLSRGVDYFERGEFSSAAIEFRNALQENPEDALARFYLGVTWLQTGDPNRALSDLERAAELGYSNAELAVPLARARAAVGQVVPLLEAKQVAGLSQSDLAQWHYLRGRAALAVDDRERAEEEFLQALAADPGDADARFGQVLLAQADGDVDRLQTWVGHTLTADETHPEAWRSRAIVALQEGRNLDAEDALDLAIANDNWPQPFTVLRRGLLRFQRGDLDGARADAEKLNRIAADAPWGAYLQGLVEFREGDRRSAQASMEQALSRTDAFAVPRLYLAAIHLEAGRYEQAEYQLDRHDFRERNDPTSNLIRAALKLEQGNTSGAHRLLDNHVQAHPGDQRALAMRNSLREGRGGTSDGALLLTALSDFANPAADEGLFAGQDEHSAEGDASAPSQGYQSVVQALNAGNFGEALERVEALLDTHPHDPELYNLKGGAHVALGQLQEAVEAFRAALQRDPHNVSAVRNLGQLLERGGRVDLALALYRQFHENNPEELEITLGLARLEASDGNAARVTSLMDQAIEHHPYDPRPRMLKGRHALLSGDPETALSVLDPIVDQQSDNTLFMRLIGEARLVAGDPDGAVEALQQAQQAGAEGWELILLLSRAMAEAERFEEAETVIRGAIAGDPEAVQPRVLLLRLLAGMGEHSRAEEAYQDLLSLSAGDSAVLIEGARAALRAGEPSIAVARFQDAWSHETTESLAFELARAHVINEDREAAEELLETWLAGQQDEPVSSATLHFLAELRRTKDTKGANAIYEQLVRHNPDDAVALNNLAWNLRETSPQRALTLAERASDAAPGSPDIRHTLAMTLAANSRVSEAITHLERLTSEQGRLRPDFQLSLARLYVRAERFADARRLLERIAGDETFEGAYEAQRVLERLP